MRKVALLLFMTLFSVLVSANNVTLQDSYNWLLERGDNGSYNNNVVDTTAVFLALNVEGALTVNEINYIKSMMDSSNCWPKGSCKVKDTVFALYALYLNGDNTTETEKWLSDAQTAFSGGGKWNLQIASSDSGMCRVKYKKGIYDMEKDIEIVEGKFPSCGDKSWLDLYSCLDPGLSNVPYTVFDIDCSELTGVVMSLIYTTGNSIYLVDTVSSSMGELVYSNGCYGVTANSACNFENTLYANWFLSEVQSDITSSLYLRANYEETNVMHNALLYLITGDSIYADKLVDFQRNSGSFDNNILNTAYALLALKKAGKSESYTQANNWLLRQEKRDGSFGNVYTTAMVLYSLTGKGVVLPSCTDGKKNQGERGTDCGGPCQSIDDCCDNGVKDIGEDGVDCGGGCSKECEELCNYNDECEPARGETCYNCPDDCEVCEDEVDVSEEICDNNDVCDVNLVEEFGLSENENYVNCPNDCFCGDGVCDDIESGDGSCAKDCGDEEPSDLADYEEEESSFWFWFFVFLILVLLGGGAYYYVKFYLPKKKSGKKELKFLGGEKLVKKEEKKEEGSGFGGTFRMPFSAKREKSHLDKEIDKSIREASRLLGKKK